MSYQQNLGRKGRANTFGTNEDSMFEETVQSSKPQKKKKRDKLPKPRLIKRPIEISKDTGFYGVWFLIALASMLVNIYQADLKMSVVSLCSLGLTVFFYRYTYPKKWQNEAYQIPFWNASVTMSVLLKSISPIMYAWRHIWLGVTGLGLAWSFFVAPSFSAMFLAGFLLVGLFQLAERNFQWYALCSGMIAWISVLPILWILAMNQSIPFGAYFIGLLLYQIHERLRDLSIENSWEE